MKITKKILENIIKEEVAKALLENVDARTLQQLIKTGDKDALLTKLVEKIAILEKRDETRRLAVEYLQTMQGRILEGNTKVMIDSDYPELVRFKTDSFEKRRARRREKKKTQ